MPWITEKAKSREIVNSSAESSGRLLYSIGADDEDEAMTELLGEVPASLTVDGWILSKVTLTVTPLGAGLWDGTAVYTKQSKQREELQPGESSFTFETGGGNIHVTHGKSTTKYPAGAEDFNNAINFDGKEVHGIDIHAPVYNFTETHIIAGAAVDSAYKLALFRATGKTNNATFKDFAAGEVLFLGVTGTRRGDDDWELTFRFAASENVTGITVAGITGVAKKGWEYLWVKWDTDVNPANARIKPKAAGVYVHKVYDDADFSTLGIGTT